MSVSTIKMTGNSCRTFTSTLGTSQFTLNRQRCFQDGHRVVISFDATANNAISSGGSIPFLLVPSEIAPSEELFGLGWVANGANINIGYVRIVKNGNSYYVGQNVYGTIASGTKLSFYCEYYI